MAKTYLVTGGTGFLGSSIVRRLLRDGHGVRVLDNNSRGAERRIADVAESCEFIEADVRDTVAVTSAARGADAVVHLAAVNGTEFFYSMPELVLDVALRGILSVVDACRSNSIGDLVVASSSEAYQTPPRVPTDESVPLVVPDVLNPRYSYGAGKIISELVTIHYGRVDFERVAVFRPHNVYGPDMGWEHVIPHFVLRAKAMVEQNDDHEVPFEIQGDGRQTRAFVHIDDLIDGVMCILERGVHLGIYNVGNPEEISIADLAQHVVGHMGRVARIIPSAPALGATNRRCPDISKVAALGYQPKVSLSMGLPGVVDWYVEHSHLKQTSHQAGAQS